MNASNKLIQLERLQQETVIQEPFPYVIVNNFIDESKHGELTQSFPKIEKGGSHSLKQLSYGGVFAALIDELRSPVFRSIVAEKFNIDLSGKPSIITVRGKTREKDGQIHTDTDTKLITILLYLNQTWSRDSGSLRLLRDGKNIDNHFVEIKPLMGTMLIFAVTPNCWHGHNAYVGERRSLQMNYLSSKFAYYSHQFRHTLSGLMKKAVAS